VATLLEAMALMRNPFTPKPSSARLCKGAVENTPCSTLQAYHAHEPVALATLGSIKYCQFDALFIPSLQASTIPSPTVSSLAPPATSTSASRGSSPVPYPVCVTMGHCAKAIHGQQTQTRPYTANRLTQAYTPGIKTADEREWTLGTS
jgi:hypothetical protein